MTDTTGVVTFLFTDLVGSTRPDHVLDGVADHRAGAGQGVDLALGHPGGGGLHDRVGGERGGTMMTAQFAPVAATASATVSKTGAPR